MNFVAQASLFIKQFKFYESLTRKGPFWNLDCCSFGFSICGGG